MFAEAIDSLWERYSTAVFLSLLFILECIVFSECFSLFFQGDALFYMAHRFTGWDDFFRGLYTLDVANWYRPLAARTIPSVFFPWFGLNPLGYHCVTFVLFFATTCIVFFFIRHVTKSFAAAAAGTVFFSLHCVNVYITYDFAFTPELFYASFYLLSSIAYLRGATSQKWYLLSLLFFLLAMMSKEAAVTLPVNIVVLAYLASPNRKKADVLPFFGILLAYYLYIVRYLKVGAGDYIIAPHKNLLSRIEDVLLWALDLGKGLMSYPVILAALIVLTYAICSLFGSRRRFTLAGMIWFFVALSPMLLLNRSFEQYYLFLPLAGIALIVGECFRWVYEKTSKYSPRIALAVVCVGLMPFVVTTKLNAHSLLYAKNGLGYSARISQRSAEDLKRSYPTIPRGATVYVMNQDEPDLWRLFGINGLIKVLYGDETLNVRYSSLGHTISEETIRSGKLIVMRYADGGLVPEDPTRLINRTPEEKYEYVTSDQFSLQVYPTQVAAGKGSYSIRISSAGDSDVEAQYRFNDGPIVIIPLHLNRNGETRFFVSKDTPPGTYRFVGMRFPSSPSWIKVAAAVTVTD